MTTDDRPARLAPGAPIPASRYRSRAFWELEWDRMWTRVWLLAGHEGRASKPGEFFTFEVGPESLLVVRGADGRLRAFHNVCQHRGALLAEGPSGCVPSFRCRYHHWRYGLDGALTSAPGAEALVEAGAVRLAEVACEARFGFAWVSMSASPEPLDAFLAPVAPILASYAPDRFAQVSEITVEAACNWKTSVDVHNEPYHLRAVHPELLEVLDDRAVREEMLGPHSGIRIALGRPARPDVAGPMLAGFMRSMGLDPARFAGPMAGLPAALAAAARVKARAEGVSLDHLSDEAIVERRQVFVFPNVQLNFSARSLEIFRHRPGPDGLVTTLFDDQFFELVRPGDPPPAVRSRRVREGEASLGPQLDPDLRLLPMLARGGRSRGFTRLLVGDRELGIAHMHRTLDGYLFDEGRGASP